ncbi:MAG: RDD family protein [Pseudomonadales bacterium]
MTNTEIQTAKLPRRLFAMLYDSLIVIAIIMLGSALAIALRVWISGADAAAGDPQTAAHGIVFQLWLFFLIAGFFVLFWRWNGQTLGMQAWRLQVRNIDGQRLTLKQCLLRLLGGLVSWVCLGIGYWVILFRSDRASWSDSWSSTQCVVLPKTK